MSSYPIVSAAAAFLLLVPACGGNPPPRAPSTPEITGVERYLPLGDGTTYTYETADESGRHDAMLIRVRRIDAQHAQLETSSGVRHLTITPGSIRREGSGFVLRDPLQKGASWEGENGGSTRVVAVDASVSVPAGNFGHCLRTVEETEGADHGRITSVFCEGVGIAELKVEQWAGAEHGVQRFVLRSYGPPVDLSAPR